VLDGEVLAFSAGAPMPFSVLQRRIGRQKLSPKILAEAPASFMAYDLLELGGIDLRALPLRERREKLAGLVEGRSDRLLLSAAVAAGSWADLAELRKQARERGVEGLMLKRWSSAYRHGRPRGDWFKWKIEPYSIDAVLVYAQPGHGRRATLMTDLTFGLWDGGELVPVAKAYSGLTDDEIDQLDRWIRQHTLERFGPVRAVEPAHVFELHFEGIAESTRHRSGVAVRFPRIARWRTDKKPADADTLQALRGMIKAPR
jgi:DNA ligase-1